MVASCSLMKADRGFSRKSTSPTRMFDASAPFGIFFMKALLTCINKANINKLFKGQVSPYDLPHCHQRLFLANLGHLENLHLGKIPM